MQQQTTNSALLKRAFFNNSEVFFGKKPKVYKNKNLKDITTVFSNIASKPIYSEIRKRYKVDKIISKILLPKHMYYVLYSFYRNNKLTIAVSNHIGQAELNMQKMILIKYLKQTKDYKDIKEVSIFRDNNFQKPISKDTASSKFITFNEQSYGIFENNLTNSKLNKKIEDIRKLIIDNSRIKLKSENE